jgi:hypothetical protein
MGCGSVGCDGECFVHSFHYYRLGKGALLCGGSVGTVCQLFESTSRISLPVKFQRSSCVMHGSAVFAPVFMSLHRNTSPESSGPITKTGEGSPEANGWLT